MAWTAGMTVGLVPAEWTTAAHAGISQPTARQVIEVGAHEVAFVFSAGAGRAIRVDAECLVLAPQEIVWQVLSDYDHLAEFVPFLTESRTLGLEAGTRRLLQEGAVGFWRFSRRFTVVFRVREVWRQDIWFDAIEGDFRQFSGHWHLEGRQPGTVIRYTVDLEPAFYVPRWLFQALERHIMLKSIEAVIQRCLDEAQH